MPLPSAVTFTPFVDIYGMLSIKDISLADWGDTGPRGSLSNIPVVPIRTPMFKSRLPDERKMQGAQGVQDAPLESGADLTRNWILFFERILAILRTTGAAASVRKLHAVVCFIDETETRDVWASIGAVDGTTDPLQILAPVLSIPRTTIPPYVEPWSVGDYVAWNDPARGAALTGIVSVSGTTIAWVSGDLFDAMEAGQTITIDGMAYTVVSIASGAKQLTVSDPPGDKPLAAYTADSFRRRYEVGQITAIAPDTGAWTIRRHWPGSESPRRATFESYMESHAAVRLYRAQTSLFTYEIKENSYLTDENTDPNFGFDPALVPNRYSGVPRRWDITLPHSAVVAVYVAAENAFGVGPWTGTNTSYAYTDSDPKQLPAAPGLRTHVGAAYWFEEKGDITVAQFFPLLPIRIQDWASIRTMYAFIGLAATNTATAEPLKVRMKILYAAARIDGLPLHDAGQPWEDLEDLVWQKVAGVADIASADQGTVEGVIWATSQENPPTERRMPYCEQALFYWDPEAAAKAWPPPVLEADAWLTFAVLTATQGGDSSVPQHITVVVQT